MIILDMAGGVIIAGGVMMVIGCLALAALPIWIGVKIIQMIKNKKQ